jgi:hypothetical protein
MDTSPVTVYSFEIYDPSRRSMEVQREKAQRATIATLGGRLLEGTGEAVECEDLDDRGFYRRLATGWGELPP